MPDQPTPGQVAYAAYLRTWPALRHPCWHDQPLLQQRAWEAAAQAVLTQALADRVWARQAPSSRWLDVPPAEETP